MSDHYCCKRCGLRYDDCKCAVVESPPTKLAKVAQSSLTDDQLKDVWIKSKPGQSVRAIANAAVAAERAQREGFYEKLWKDFVSLQSGDVQLMCKEAEMYRAAKQKGDE